MKIVAREDLHAMFKFNDAFVALRDALAVMRDSKNDTIRLHAEKMIPLLYADEVPKGLKHGDMKAWKFPKIFTE